MCPTFKRVAKHRGYPNCDGSNIPIKPQYSYSMNAYLGGDGWEYLGKKKILMVLCMSSAKKTWTVAFSRQIWYFGERQSLAV